MRTDRAVNSSHSCMKCMFECMYVCMYELFMSDLRRSLPQTSGPSRASSEVRQGCSGCYPIGPQKCQGQRLPNLTKQIVLMFDCPCDEKYFPYNFLDVLVFQLRRVASFCPTVTLIYLSVKVLVLNTV